ncbi:MAG: hypothetical protein OXC84_10270 [Gammaproteobacteria bacterium]|nr:hypothetical protein [Gammaproteobacteria bacterium]
MIELTIFRNNIENIYGYYLQVDTAMQYWRKNFLQDQLSRGTANVTNTIFFGNNSLNSQDAAHQYRRTFGELLKESAEEGITTTLHRRSVLVFLVASWEVRHREKIAVECKLECKDQLKSDVFRDLNRYRQAILHNEAQLSEKPKVIRLFRKGDQVTLTRDHMDTIFRKVIVELNRIGRDYYGKDPGFRFDVPMHRPSFR